MIGRIFFLKEYTKGIGVCFVVLSFILGPIFFDEMALIYNSAIGRMFGVAGV